MWTLHVSLSRLFIFSIFIRCFVNVCFLDAALQLTSYKDAAPNHVEFNYCSYFTQWIRCGKGQVNGAHVIIILLIEFDFEYIYWFIWFDMFAWKFWFISDFIAAIKMMQFELRFQFHRPSSNLIGDCDGVFCREKNHFSLGITESIKYVAIDKSMCDFFIGMHHACA